jgi:hypothetical protein
MTEPNGDKIVRTLGYKRGEKMMEGFGGHDERVDRLGIL